MKITPQLLSSDSFLSLQGFTWVCNSYLSNKIWWKLKELIHNTCLDITIIQMWVLLLILIQEDDKNWICDSYKVNIYFSCLSILRNYSTIYLDCSSPKYWSLVWFIFFTFPISVGSVVLPQYTLNSCNILYLYSWCIPL